MTACQNLKYEQSFELSKLKNLAHQKLQEIFPHPAYSIFQVLPSCLPNFIRVGKIFHDLLKFETFPVIQFRTFRSFPRSRSCHSGVADQIYCGTFTRNPATWKLHFKKTAQGQERYCFSVLSAAGLSVNLFPLTVMDGCLVGLFVICRRGFSGDSGWVFWVTHLQECGGSGQNVYTCFRLALCL